MNKSCHNALRKIEFCDLKKITSLQTRSILPFYSGLKGGHLTHYMANLLNVWKCFVVAKSCTFPSVDLISFFQKS